jgi:hypothetical protein
VAAELASGKAYLHTAKDVNQRPVIVIRVAKHVTGEQPVKRMHARAPAQCFCSRLLNTMRT